MTGGEFKSILLPYYRRMYATAFAILRNADDASDAVQDAISQLWQRCPKLAIPDNPEAFCIAATRNICIDRLRNAANRYYETADAIINLAADRRSDDVASYDSTKAYIRRVLYAFPDKQRQILTLTFISQLLPDEISKVTGESPPNIRKIISRGRIKLKQYISNESNH